MAETRSKTAARKGSTFSLPNTFKTWPRVSDSLIKIQEGQIRELQEFEKIYPQLEFSRESEANPKFGTLRHVLKDAEHITKLHFLGTLLPWIAGKALQVEELFRAEEHKLPLLCKHVQGEVVLTRLQVCCLLSLAFFGTLAETKGAYQHLVFTFFLEVDFFKSQRSKLLCLLTYFDRLRRAESQGEQDFLAMNISIQRRAELPQESAVFWGKSEVPLSAFSCEEDGLIEDSHGDLQADFANEYIGGGVLQMGNVQEEIRFVINPECLVSLLFCEAMEANEAILIQGAEQFSEYSGYGGTFNFTGPHTDTNPIVRNRRCVAIVAIDAIPQGFANQSQFDRYSLARELNKAYCGFSFSIAGDNPSTKEMRPVATGNWGCGAFGGNKQLKTLLQWMAASMAGRPIKYFSFRDHLFSKEQMAIVTVLQEKKVTVGQLYEVLVSSSREMAQTGVFKCVAEKVSKL